MVYQENEYGQLSLWGTEEGLSRFVINGARAMAAADVKELGTEVGKKSEWVQGSYVGDGTDRAISLGFGPSAVLLERANGLRDQYVLAGGLALPGQYSLNGSVTVGADGFRLSSGNNLNGQVYFYLAVS